MFNDTVKGIWLTGSSAYLQEYADTATNGNVFVGAIPLSYSLTAERVASDGGTVIAPEGDWLHLVLSLSWSNFQDNSIDDIILYIDAEPVVATAYTDAAKTSAITLPGWRPSATAEAHAWVHINQDQHNLVVAVSDTYHTGDLISLVVPGVFRTIDVLAGGRGIAFGKIAEQEGFDCAMDAIFRGSVLIPNLIGAMTLYAGGVEPEGWLFCKGQEVSRTEYSYLFDVIGTTYGEGDGSTTFNVPDLKNRFPVGAGSSYGLNDKGGSNTVTLNTKQIPSHTHAIKYENYQRGAGSNPTMGYIRYNAGAQTGTSEPAGGGQAHENRPPYIAFNFIIYAGQ